MTKLKAVDPKEAEPSKPKILIFGKPGVGKTWTSLDFPSVYYIDSEGGASRSHYTDKLKKSGGVYFGPEQGSTDFAAVIGQVQALATEQHSYRTLVLDSGSKLYNHARFEAAEKGGDDYGRDKKEANKPARRLTNWLQKIDMNVIIVAHEIPQWGIDSKGERTQIGVTFDAWDKLDYELDLCLNIIKAGPNRTAKIVKSRLTGFPDGEAFKWSYDDFSGRYGKDVIEKDGKRIVLASPEQITAIKNLLNIIKLPEGQLDKWLKSANAETLEEIEQSKAQAIIDHINVKYIKTQGEAA